MRLKGRNRLLSRFGHDGFLSSCKIQAKLSPRWIYPRADSDIAKQFDLFGHSYLTDPSPVFAKMRAATPVFYTPELDYWIVTRYADIHGILPNTKQYLVAEALPLFDYYVQPQLPYSEPPSSM
jgi:cytochrome P450